MSPWLLLIPGVPTAAAVVLALLWRLERRERAEWQAQAVKLAGSYADEVLRNQGERRVLERDLTRERAQSASDALADPSGDLARRHLQRRLRSVAEDDTPTLPRKPTPKP